MRRARNLARNSNSFARACRRGLSLYEFRVARIVAEKGHDTMELTLSIRTDGELLYATYSGEFSLAEAERTFLEILEALERHEVRKVVVDGRAITGELSDLERFFYGAFVAEEVNKLCNRARCHSPQFAYVLTPPVLDPRRFGETVAVNRGMFVKAFDNLNDALEWLGISAVNEAR